MKILISWCAFQHDFRDGVVSDAGPTLQFHQYFFDHDRHIILSTEAGDDTRLELLLNKLALDFPDRQQRIEGRYLDIKNDEIINPAVIRPKVEGLLQEFAEHDIDLFISPGTPAMQVVWYLCHASLGLKTRLFQTRPPKFDKGTPKLIHTELERWTEPVAAIIKENLQDRPALTGDYLITPALKPIYERANKVGEAERVTCLIQGDSGTGKEHLARYIHDHSARANRPFEPVNCSALGNELLESRLFGYAKGAFTGAAQDRKGYFEAAHGGTIFLDEIGDISPYMQQSLLRVVQTGEFTPVGETKSRKVDVRIIAATHRDLRGLCSNGTFRWDLFYRLSVTELHLPALVDRGQDEKRQLVDHFLESKQKAFRRSKRLRFSSAAYQFVDSYTFPGNVRELENLIESLYVFVDRTIEIVDLPDWITKPVEALNSFNWSIHEKALIQRTLSYYVGNKSKACSALGYGSINTLVSKMKLYGID